MSVSFVSLRSTRVHLRNNTFILRKIVENHCDMAYQKHCKIVISKEVCLHCVTLAFLKALGHVTVNKPVISIIYVVVHTWPLCFAQISVDGVNPLESYFQKSTNISAIVQHISVSFVSLQSSRLHLQSSTVILKK